VSALPRTDLAAERPPLVVISPGQAFEWLRTAAGTAELADLRHRHARRLCTIDRRQWQLTGEQLAGLINARYSVVDEDGEPALFPAAAARRAVAAPGELPNVPSLFPLAVVQ
jgi:hypothetical protein